MSAQTTSNCIPQSCQSLPLLRLPSNIMQIIAAPVPSRVIRRQPLPLLCRNRYLDVEFIRRVDDSIISLQTCCGHSLKEFPHDFLIEEVENQFCCTAPQILEFSTPSLPALASTCNEINYSMNIRGGSHQFCRHIVRIHNYLGCRRLTLRSV